VDEDKKKKKLIFLSGTRFFVAISQRLEIRKEGRNGFRRLFVNAVQYWSPKPSAPK